MKKKVHLGTSLFRREELTRIEQEFAQYGTNYKDIFKKIIEKHDGFIKEAAEELKIIPSQLRQWCVYNSVKFITSRGLSRKVLKRKKK